MPFAKYPGNIGSGGGGGGGSGTVTSVGLADNSSTPIYDISGSPVLTSGTLSFSLKSQAQNLFFLSPDGSAGAPGFRAISATDLGPVLGTISAAGVDGITITGGVSAIIGSGVAVAQHVASASFNGYLSSTDWSTFNNKQAALTLGNLTDVGTDGITVTGGSGAVVGSGTSISQRVADTTHNGYLSSTDWNTFNGKQAALTIGNLTAAGTDGIAVTSGTGAVIGSGTSIAQHVADTTHNGYLSSTDWNTFNGKGSVTSVALSVPGSSIFGVTGSPVTTSGTLGLTTTGTSGGVPYFSSTSVLSSSLLLTADQVIVGGGAAAAPKTLAAGSQYQVLRMGATTPAYGSINLDQSAAVTGALGAANGGTGIANNAASTLTISGNFGTTFTVTNTTSLTLPTSGTVSVLTTATQAEQETGTSTTAAVTPGRQQFHPSAPKCWIQFTSITTTAITVSYNVTSVTDNGTGATTITIATDFSAATYCTAGMSKDGGSGAGCLTLINGNKAAGTCPVLTITPSTLAAADNADTNVTMLGDQA
jgi:hypothetical protein